MNKKGITLISLIITVIILLILTGLSLGILNNRRIIDSAKSVTKKTQNQIDDNDKMSDEIRNSMSAVEGSVITFVVGTAVFLTKKGMKKIYFPSQDPVSDTKAFAGWYYDAECTKEAKEGTAINQDITLYAKMVDAYTIIFMANGSLFQTLTGTTVKFPNTTPTAKTLVFDGWYYDEACTKEAKTGDTLTQNTTLYANMLGITNPLSGQSFEASTYESNPYTYIFKGNVTIENVSLDPKPTPDDLSGHFYEGIWWWPGNNEIGIDSNGKIVCSDNDTSKIKWKSDELVTATFSVKKKDGTAVTFTDTFKVLGFPISFCVLAGTLITLANGTKKKVEDLNYEDDLLVWDFDNGCMASAKPLWLQKEQKADRYNLFKFSDGNILKTVNQHRIFNAEKGAFTYPMTDQTPIGTTTLNDKGEKVKLISKEIIDEKVTYYNIITKYHMNAFTGGILTSCRLSNLYPIKNLKYVKDGRKLISKEEYAGVPEEYYEGLRLAEQPQEINKKHDQNFGNNIKEYVEHLIESAK